MFIAVYRVLGRRLPFVQRFGSLDAALDRLAWRIEFDIPRRGMRVYEVMGWRWRLVATDADAQARFLRTFGPPPFQVALFAA
jgi:hypothetical protein